ncbi:MAG: hypothetical protein ABI947_21850 [Chloroflexota bacterium]
MDALIKQQDKPRIVRQVLKLEYVPLQIVKGQAEATKSEQDLPSKHEDETIKANDWLKSDEAAFWMGM